MGVVRERAETLPTLYFDELRIASQFALDGKTGQKKPGRDHNDHMCRQVGAGGSRWELPRSWSGEE